MGASWVNIIIKRGGKNIKEESNQFYLSSPVKKKRKERKKKPKSFRNAIVANNEFSYFFFFLSSSLFSEDNDGGTHISFLLLFYYKFHVGDAKREKEEVIRLIAIEISPYTHTWTIRRKKKVLVSYFLRASFFSLTLFTRSIYTLATLFVENVYTGDLFCQKLQLFCFVPILSEIVCVG